MILTNRDNEYYERILKELNYYNTVGTILPLISSYLVILYTFLFHLYHFPFSLTVALEKALDQEFDSDFPSLIYFKRGIFHMATTTNKQQTISLQVKDLSND